VTGPAAAAVFSRHAGDYDALRRRLVPGYDEFYGAAVEVLGRQSGGVGRVLDLGAGTGLLSAEIAAALPGVELELLDASEPMLAQARDRLGDAVCAVHVADMAAPLPPGPFDAIVSALAIHHLEHEDQRRLLTRVHERLRPGGVFVNAEQVCGPSAALTRAYEEIRVRRCLELGASERELDEAQERMRHDRCTDVGTQLTWLHEAGFETADCVYKSWGFAVLAAWKGEGR
jgi:tRNA (cmo5U34)-methyltransferase